MSAVTDLLRQQRADLHISASAIRCLQECPRQYWLRYVEGVPPQDRSARMILGSAIHKALAHFYRCLRDGIPEPGHEALLGIAASTIAAEAIGDPPLLFDEGEDASALVTEASRLLEVFLKDGFRPKRVVAVEEAFLLDLSDPATGELFDFEERVAGAIDLIAMQDDGAMVVVDHKVCGRKDTAKAERPDVQMGLYAWAAQQMLGTEQVGLVYQDLITTKKPQVVLQEVHRISGDDVEAVEAVSSGLELTRLAVDHPAGKRLMGRRRSWKCRSCSWRKCC